MSSNKGILVIIGLLPHLMMRKIQSIYLFLLILLLNSKKLSVNHDYQSVVLKILQINWYLNQIIDEKSLKYEVLDGGILFQKI